MRRCWALLAVLGLAMSGSGCADEIVVLDPPPGHPANLATPSAPPMPLPRTLAIDEGAVPRMPEELRRGSPGGMRGSHGGGSGDPAASEGDSPMSAAVLYRCSMRCDVVAGRSGGCPKCGGSPALVDRAGGP